MSMTSSNSTGANRWWYLSAYDIAVKHGFSGSVEDFLREIYGGAADARQAAATATDAATAAERDAGRAQEAAATAESSEEAAGAAQEVAQRSASDSEAFGAGTRGGTPVESDDDAYHNNAKYYSDNAAALIGSDIEAYVTAAVAEWIAENLDPEDPPVVIDASLSTVGAAADAKACGDYFDSCLIQRGTIPPGEDIDAEEYRVAGQWYVGAGDNRPTNWPFTATSAGRLLVFGSATASWSGRVQMAYNMRNEFAWRVSYSTGGGNGAWGSWRNAASMSDVETAAAACSAETAAVDEKFLAEHPLFGKRMAGIGGSWIKQINAPDYTPESQQWFSLIAAKYGMTSANYGIAGTCIAPHAGDNNKSAYARIDTILETETTADYFIIQGGGNDSTANIPIYEADAPEGVVSFEEALTYIIQQIRLKLPRTRILCVTCAHRWNQDKSNTSSSAELKDQDYATAMVNICRKLGVPCFDLWHDSGIAPCYNWDDPQNDNSYWPYLHWNNKHLNVEGNAWLAPIIAKRLEMI